MAAMCTVCAIADSVLEQRYYPRNAPWLYGDNRSDDNPSINGLVTWAFALLTLVFMISTHTPRLIYEITVDSRISYPSRFTYQSNLYAHVKPLSFISTAKSVMTRRAQLLKPGVGICLMTSARSNIFFLTRRELLRRYEFRSTYRPPLQS